MTGLIERQHDIAATGIFNGKTGLGFAAVDIAMNRENGGGLVFGTDAGWHIKQTAQGLAVIAGKTQILDGHVAGGLNEMSEQCAQKNDDPSNMEQAEFA